MNKKAHLQNVKNGTIKRLSNTLEEDHEYFNDMVSALCGDRFDCKVYNFGWQGLDGEAFDLKSKNAMAEILPNTECTLDATPYEDRIEVNNSHHDKPCGGEVYIITPSKSS